MYVKYCENKPKSELIVARFIDFFEVRLCVNSIVNMQAVAIIYTKLGFRIQNAVESVRA